MKTIEAEGAHDGNSVCQGENLRDNPQESRHVFQGEYDTGEEEHRCQQTGEVEVEMIDRFHEGGDEWLKRLVV